MRNRLMLEIGAHAEALRSVAPEETEALLWVRQEVQDSQDLPATIQKHGLDKYIRWIREL